MHSSNELSTIPISCVRCDGEEAYLTSHTEHMTARCVKCHTYIKHISRKEYMERAFPQEMALRKEIKEIIEAWCERKEKKGYVGWKRLYSLVQKDQGVDLIIWGQGGSKKKRKSGMDVAMEMGILDKVHALAIEHFMEIEKSQPEQTQQQVEDDPEVDYPTELIERIEKQIPDEILQVLQAKGFDIIGIFKLIKEHIIVWQAEQFYSDRKAKEKK